MPDGLFVDLTNAREALQVDIMRQLQAEGKCPFCPEYLPQHHTQPILKQGEFWVVTRNMFPYRNTLHHFLLISMVHIESIMDMTPEMAIEALLFRQWLMQEFKLPGGATCERFGDTPYSGGTLHHLHQHVIVPDLQSPAYVPVRFKIGTNPENI
jgi:ATP adenylyltransferase